MYGEIKGLPESILRYQVDLITANIKAFDYRNINKLFKIRTEIDKVYKKPNVIIETDTKMIPCGNKIGNPLFFYDDIVRHQDKKITPIKVLKNTTNESMTMNLPYHEGRDFSIEIKPGCTGILYDTYLYVYDNKAHCKITEYHVISDGLFIIEDTESNYVLPDELIEDKSFNICQEELIKPIIPIGPVPSARNLPLKLSLDLMYDIQDIYLLYNKYGLVSKIKSENNNYDIYYNDYEYDGWLVNESVHKLLFDNFDWRNHILSDKAIVEIYKSNVTTNTAEFIQMVYKDVTKIDGTEKKDYNMIDFDYIVNKYFNY